MEVKATLKDIFSQVKNTTEPIWSWGVSSLSANEAAGGIDIELVGKEKITDNKMAEIKYRISEVYGVRCNITILLDATEGDSGDKIVVLLVDKFPSVATAVRTSKLIVEENKLLIRLADNIFVNRIIDLAPQMEKEIAHLLGKGLRIEVESAEGEAQRPTYEQVRQQHMEKMMVQAETNTTLSSTTPQRTAQEPKKSFIRKNNPLAPKFKPNESDNLIYGKPVPREISKIEDINLDSGKVTVKGEVFNQTIKKLNGKEKTVLSFEFTDGTGSLRATKILFNDEAAELAKKVAPGANILVQGQIAYSQFEREININPSAIVGVAKKKRLDNAIKKRVELHLHTNMSAMDGLCDTKKVISLAADMGHSAIAITDHGVAQAFPDAMNGAKASKKAGKPIKVLYGIEAYCVNDISSKGPVKGYTDQNIDDETVVFDLETTGLSARNCEIIEIACAIVKGDEVIDTYHTFVKPKQSIPLKITELTGITDKDVKDAKSIEEILPEFLDFCGKRPLCAHNADFDISFVRAACENSGIQRDFCSIDTVELSRALMPNLSKYKLNNLADAFGLKFKHHRADDDTRVLAEIYINLKKMLKSRMADRGIRDINAAVDQLKAGVSTDGQRSHHLIILVKNREGLISLYKMISDAHLKYYKRHPIIPMSLLAANRENLILGSACEAGELFSSVVSGKPWGELVKTASFYDFLEIQPIANNRFMIAKGLAKDEEQLKEFNRTILKLGDAIKKPVCATGDVHFIDPTDCVYREILMTGMGFSDAGNQAPLYYKTTVEMLDEFSYLGEKRAYEVVVENTNAIADMCEEIQPVLDGTYPPSIDNSAQDIQQMAWSKANELYSENGVLHPIVAQRLEDELKPIIKHGFDVMYIIAQKLVKKSLDDGYLVGSRGSVGSSFVAYLTGITEVNSLGPHYRCPKCCHAIFDNSGKYYTGVDMPDLKCPKCDNQMIKDGFNIPFATFLGFDGDKAPDIDLNFSGEYQLRAHKYTVELFGKDNVFKAGTIGTIKDKTAYGFVKKYLEEKGKIVSGPEENRLVSGCTGIKRTTGQHPGGLIVVPKGRSIYEFCPVQHPADDINSDIITTHFDYHSIHDNLLKLDLLGHDDPTMIRKLHDLSGIDPRTVPLDDKETMRIFTDIGALGIESDDILETTGAAAIPEFGTKFVRGMLTETQPNTFDGLLRISGLSHGTGVWVGNSQDIIRSGAATLRDIICVRDDIFTFLIFKGMDSKVAFTIAESVRKGKGLKPEWEEQMLKLGLPDWYIDSCKKIEYMFPRAHAVAYVMMAYRIAWFKVHRPLDFYNAYFSIRAGGFDGTYMTMGDGVVCKKYKDLKGLPKRTSAEDDTLSTLEIVHEFYKRGFTFTPVDIYRSEATSFLIDGDTLIPPFTSIPGIGEAAAYSIVSERQKGKFMSAEDITLRCDKVSKAVVENLTNAGALEGIPKSNQLDLFESLGM